MSKPGRKPTNETRDDLYCPECAAKGMLPLTHRAESGRWRYKCRACGFRTTQTLYTAPTILPEFQMSRIKKHKRFIITSAVNDTDLVKGAFKTFVKMAKELDACLLIIPGVYKNPDLKHQGVINSYSWPSEIMPYLCNADVKLNNSLTIRGLTRIQYTAINPLSGMNHAGDICSEIYGHPQIAMEPVATPKSVMPKIMHTTGTISVKNYGGSKQAKKAEFHHSIGGIFVEIEGDKFWPTQIRYDGQGVHLFDKFYSPRAVRKVKSIPAIVFGDSHLRFLRPEINRAHNKVRKALQPEYEVYHDLHDHHIGSHHNENNTLFHLKKSISKEFSIRKELNLCVNFLNDKPNAVLVDSNHNRHLDQWFNRFKPNRDPVNLELYYELAGLASDDIKAGGDGNLLRCYLEKYCKHPVTYVTGNELFEIEEIDISQHGDRGPNGARGSARSFSKSGYKTIIGHSHTPRIEKGCYQVGTSTIDMDYAVGYSSWLITNCFIYPNGKRGMFTLVEGKLSPMMRKL